MSSERECLHTPYRSGPLTRYVQYERMPAYTLQVRATDKVCPLSENACIHLSCQGH
ncbi:hypothetical protein DPMN_104302 [Dreissena polymorpha]|uniref:Uncharacterized protein n=1 Tax=Dreissena polymorpha TaxID=45954 RepID=A0A9D4HA54_DREPO|nr:hypothetical protein DPMN_104302 [Dreissena polymorpha]